MSRFSTKERAGEVRFLEAIKRFLKNEDPIVWKSFIVAAVLTLLFYIFVLIYTR